MIKKNITLDYDDEADVLYIGFGEPREAVTEEFDNMGVRIDPKTGEIVGLTVIEFLARFKEKHEPIKVSV